MTGAPVATVRALFRYPVKSMRGEPLDALPVTFQGVTGDRAYAFVQTESRSLFPWLTGREYPDLLRYRPVWQSTAAGRPALAVTTPTGDTYPVDSDTLLTTVATAAGRPVTLGRDYRGTQDVAPLSLLSTASVRRIAAASGVAVTPSRFRPNIVLDPPSGADDVDEQTWVGCILRLGETVRIAVTQPDQRCVMITLDPDTAQANAEVLKAVATRFANRAGVYATVLTPGEVKPGDPVHLER